MASPRQLAAIMFTDIVGYTELMQRNEAHAVAVTKRYLAVFHETAAAHGGKVLNDYGEGSLCIFTSAMQAIECAVSIQRQLHQEPAVPVRIGLHIGEIFFEEGKVFGDGVNIASRIQSLGVGGAVLFSKEMYETIKNHPRFKAVLMGSFEFKNVEESMEVFALSGKGLTVPRREQMQGKLKVPVSDTRRSRGTQKSWLIATATVLLVLVILAVAKKMSSPTAAYGAAKEPNSIAVLYFSNMSGDPRQEYFSDGITEEIITRLSMIDGLQVKSRTSVLQYKGKGKSVRQIARELRVKHILEGSVRKQGNQLRVTAQLIDATRDEHIWAEHYDRELKDVFSVQSDIARHIASRFQIALSDDTRKRLEAPLTLNTEAYDYYLKARSLSFLDFGFGGEATSRQTSIELLRQALELDPSFAEAYALQSLNYSNASRDGKDAKRWLDSAALLARAAIRYGPTKPDGYEALATAYETTGDIDKALKWALKADEAQPYSRVLYTARLYARRQQYDKAMEWTMKAVRHDPAEPSHYISKAFLFYELGMMDSMKRYIDVAAMMAPERTDAQSALMLFYRTTYNLEEFERLVRTKNSNDDKVYNFSMAIFYLFERDWKTADSFYRISTHPEDMDAALVKLHLGDEPTGRRYFQKALDTRLSATGYWDQWRYFDIARIYAALRDPRYLEYLNKAIKMGWHDYPFFEQDPFFDFVRPTPAFREVARKMYERNETFKARLLKGL
ncbi:MAG TPA: adenylate/guanylate cyclase domain-containing protein [Chitinophagaceae bacterium]